MNFLLTSLLGRPFFSEVFKEMHPLNKTEARTCLLWIFPDLQRRSNNNSPACCVTFYVKWPSKR